LRAPYWWRSHRRGDVFLPLAIGLVLGGLGLWSALVYTHNQAEFRAEAVRARAVIEKIYTSAPSQGYGAPTFDEYALIRFGAQGRIAHAQVLLVRDCSGVCVPGYHVGQVLTVAYSSENVRYAQLYSRVARPSANFLYVFLMLGVFAVMFLAAAVINMFTA
jgi:Protein of unknown function (DUF3592)